MIHYGNERSWIRNKLMKIIALTILCTSLTSLLLTWITYRAPTNADIIKDNGKFSFEDRRNNQEMHELLSMLLPTDSKKIDVERILLNIGNGKQTPIEENKVIYAYKPSQNLFSLDAMCHGWKITASYTKESKLTSITTRGPCI